MNYQPSININPINRQAGSFERSCIAWTLLALVLLVVTTARAQILYSVSLNPDTLRAYDLRTGATSIVGALEDGGAYIAGLAYDPALDQLLGVGQDNNLYGINRFTGTANRIGALQVSIFSPGLDFDPNTRTLYLTSTAWYTTSLYRVNLSTGAATKIGDVPGGVIVNGLAFDPKANILYGISSDTEKIYRINTRTAALTEISGTGLGIGTAEAAWNTDANLLYFISSNQGLVYSEDPNRGGGAAYVGSFGTVPFFGGLAYVPEPSAFSIVLLGLPFFAWRTHRSKAPAKCFSHPRPAV